SMANLAELTTIASIGIAVWRHPYITLGLALLLLVLLMLLVRRIVLTLRRLLSGQWYRSSSPAKDPQLPVTK
ncbi:MAG TPA: hypothetical protein VK565_01100, partial [Gemmatimonadaceae bacterium]|nr:hypothetical protein [Gemmatimonadaceae bacterium]